MLQGPTSPRSDVPGAPEGGPTRARRWRVIAFRLLVVAGAAFAFGPRVGVEEGWVLLTSADPVEERLAREEARVPDLRPGEARAIEWASPAMPGRTPVSLVYLHGFSADRHEVDPLVGDLARDLGANVYWARLTGHGQDGAALGEATAEDWLEDASEAVEIGGRIGDRVVLVGTSTGGTLALWAASQSRGPGQLAAVVLISPNLGLRDRTSEMLLWPWGEVIARVVLGRERCFEPANEAQARHWTTCYPPRALVEMMSLVDHVRYRGFEDYATRTLVIYSRRDEVVDPEATERMIAGLGDRAVAVLVNDSGDPQHHVLAGDILSPRTTDRIRGEILDFLRGIPSLGLGDGADPAR